MLTQLGASLVGLFDSIMVGHYATVDLAAVSFANALFFLAMVFAMGSLMAIKPLVGICVGEMNACPEEKNAIRHKIAVLFQNGILFTMIQSALMLLLLGGCIPFLEYFGQDPEVIRVARPYYILIVISLVPFLFFTFFKQFLEGLGNTLVAMVITLAMNGLNILLNWVFIYGHWGAEAMGATGAGIGSLISRVGMALCFVIAMWLHRDWKYYIKTFAWRNISWQEIKKQMTLGFPIGAQTFLETFT